LVVSVGLVASIFASAFEFLNALNPTWRGCLVLDLHMPGMNGLSLQKRLQEMRVDVFISGSVDIPTAFQAIKDGAVEFLQKPYPQQQSVDAIHKALRLARA
jgi:FixJ family two-component response regulator